MGGQAGPEPGCFSAGRAAGSFPAEQPFFLDAPLKNIGGLLNQASLVGQKKPLLRSRHFPSLHESEAVSPAGPKRSGGRPQAVDAAKRRARWVVGPGLLPCERSEPKPIEFSPQGWPYGRVAPGGFMQLSTVKALLFSYSNIQDSKIQRRIDLWNQTLAVFIMKDSGTPVRFSGQNGGQL
jgi:hypothetical protein